MIIANWSTKCGFDECKLHCVPESCTVVIAFIDNNCFKIMNETASVCKPVYKISIYN